MQTPDVADAAPLVCPLTDDEVIDLNTLDWFASNRPDLMTPESWRIKADLEQQLSDWALTFPPEQVDALEHADNFCSEAEVLQWRALILLWNQRMPDDPDDDAAWEAWYETPFAELVGSVRTSSAQAAPHAGLFHDAPRTRRSGRRASRRRNKPPARQDDPEPEPRPAELTAEEIAGRLAHDDDEPVAAWAATLERRAAARQVNLSRAVDRLLAPLVDAGYVSRGQNGYSPTAEGVATFGRSGMDLRA